MQYVVNTRKQLGTNMWGNTYHVEANSLQEASDYGIQIANIEKTVLHNTAKIITIGVRTAAEEDKLFNTMPANITGTWTGTGDASPLFVVARIDFTIFGERPSRKFLRAVVNETALGAFGLIVPAHLTMLTTNYAAPMASLPFLTDERGNRFNGSIVYQYVTKRNLTRRARREAKKLSL